MSQGTRNDLSRRQVIRTGLLAGGSAGLFLLGDGFAPAQAQGSPSAWSIGDDGLRRRIVCKPGGGISTEELQASAGAAFIRPDELRRDMAAEFSFQCNGTSYRGSDSGFELQGAEESAIVNGRSLAVSLHHRALALDVTVVYRSYRGHPALRKQLVLRNRGTGDLRLSHLCIEALGLALGPESEIILNAQYGAVPREILYTGRSEDAGLLLANSRTGVGIAILSEVPGYMKRTDIAGWDDARRIRLRAMYDTDLMPFERTLKPGEAFTTAGVSLVAFRRDDAFHDPRWVMPSYTADVLVRRTDAKGAPWIYNTWEPFERTINQSTTLQLVDVAGEMGFDIFTIDDGWQKEYGSNAVNLEAFPGGLQPILTAIEAKGMRLGLWIPLAAVGLTSEDYRDHPTLAAEDQAGQRKQTSTAGGIKVLMCLASAFRDVAAARVIDAIDRFHLAYVKLDLTTIFNAYGEAPGCAAKGHDHGNWAESLNMIYEGIAYVTRLIYAKHPEVLLDLTFELWGQKHVIDAGLLCAGDLDWLSNVDDKSPDSAGPVQARQLLYQRAVTMPVESMLIGNLHADMPSVQESFATAIGSAPLLLGDLRNLTGPDRAWYRQKIAWFKALRQRTRISQSFFPLGHAGQPSSAEWDGFARLARSGEGIIVVFGNRSAATHADVQLPLLPEGRYRVRSVLSNTDLGVLRRSDFVRGVRVPFPAANRVDVLEVSRAG